MCSGGPVSCFCHPNFSPQETNMNITDGKTPYILKQEINVYMGHIAKYIFPETIATRFRLLSARQEFLMENIFLGDKNFNYKETAYKRVL